MNLIPRRRHLRRMSLVHAYAADFMILGVQDHDLTDLLQYLNSKISKNVGTGSGQHWLFGVGYATPVNEISPCFFTSSAAWGFKIGLV
jgi:hypothetical protein